MNERATPLAGYYTSKRTTRSHVWPYKGQRLTGSFTGQRSHTPDTQVTTSFRTRGRDSNDKLVSDNERPFGFLTGYTESFDTGHPFNTERLTSWISHPDVYAANSLSQSPSRWYRGPLWPVTGNVMTRAELPPWDYAKVGNTLVGRASPTRPFAGVSVALGELRHGVPQIIGSTIFDLEANLRLMLKREVPGKAASEYLNLQFGWLPFLADITRTLEAVVKSKDILDQYARDSGRQVRRHAKLPVETTTSDELFATHVKVSLPGSSSEWLSMFHENEGSTRVSTVITQQISFSGAFLYFLPDDDSFVGKMERWASQANHLLGLKLTPEVLWELTPWSWLIDWYTAFGSSLSTASRFQDDGLVMKYGYVMRHTDAITSYTTKGQVFKYGDLTNEPYSVNFRTERKERFRATPYGFGLSVNSFTEFQWSILASLGLTKAPKTMRYF